MSRSRRHAVFLLAFCAAGIAYLMMTVFSSGTAHADEVFMVGGADVASIPGAPNGAYMPALFGGELCKNGNHCTVVNFNGGSGVMTPNNPQPLDDSVAAAVPGLVQAIKNTPGPKKIVTISAGQPVGQQAVQQLQNDPNGPSPDQLSIIEVGPINRGIGNLVPPGTRLDSIGYTVQPDQPTKYPTTVVTNESDGLATPTPDPMKHPLAAMNDIVGAEYAHVSYFTSRLDDPNNTVTQNGNETDITLHNQGDPPLVQAADDMGQPQMADQIRAPLMADIDAAKQDPPQVGAPMGAPPQMVDQLIRTAAPMLGNGIQGQTNSLVNQLAPIFENDPQMQQYVPPGLVDPNIGPDGAPAQPIAMASAPAPQPADQAAAFSPAPSPAPDQTGVPDTAPDNGPAPNTQDNGPAPVVNTISNIVPNAPADGGFNPVMPT